MSPSFISALIVMFLMLMVARGFVPMLPTTDKDSFTAHLIKGIIATVVVGIARSGYWDVLQFLSGDAWASIRDALWGQDISTAFNVGYMWALYHFLKARWCLIPEDERVRWRWYTAWAHPGDNCVIDWRR